MLRDLFGEGPSPVQPEQPSGMRERDEEDEKGTFAYSRPGPTPGDVLVRRTEVVAFRFVSTIKNC